MIMVGDGEVEIFMTTGKKEKDYFEIDTLG